MEETNDVLNMLDLLTAPAFCVADRTIVKVNISAAALQFATGMNITPMLTTGSDEYAAFRQGCLCLTLSHLDQSWNASITRCGNTDVFLLEDAVQPELQALALAARELRGPLNNAMLMADKLLQTEDSAMQDSAARLNRGLYQLLRIVGNMSDAGASSGLNPQSLHEMGTVLGEIAQKLRTLAEASHRELAYEGLTETVYSLCNPQQLERALMNLLSNSIKFTPRGSTIRIRCTLCEKNLRISMEDSGTGIEDALLRSIFYRYLRQPAIEDSRHGIGLGMVLARTAAQQHGGTVLIDRPEETGTRVTLTLAIRQEGSLLRDNVLLPLSGGYDPGLIELSEVLPAHMYNGSK